MNPLFIPENASADDIDKLLVDIDEKTPIVIMCERKDKTSKEILSTTDTEEFNIDTVIGSIVYGIDIAKKIRRKHKRKNPILFTSFAPESFILKQPGTSILNTSGHGFLQIPFTDTERNEALKKMEPLDDIELSDIIINYCSPSSFVREGFHSLKGNITMFLNTYQISKGIEAARSFRDELKKECSSFPDVVKKYEESISGLDVNPEKVLKDIINYTDEYLINSIPDDEGEIKNPVTKKDWEILFLDDNPEQIIGITSRLDGYIKYHIARTVEEAKEIIIKDNSGRTPNRIAVVVSDFRLEVNNTTEKGHRPQWQKKQGYQFITWLAEQDRHQAMIVLSGLSKWFLMESFRKKRINVKIYSKQTLNRGGEVSFLEDIIDMGDRVEETIISTPSSKSWNNHFKLNYNWLRNECNEFDNFIRRVNENAALIIQDIDSQYEQNIKPEFMKITKVEVGGAQTELKGLDPRLFEQILTYRRVLIYYTIKGTITHNWICKLLVKSDAAIQIPNDIEYKEGKKQVFFNNAYTEKDTPYFILLEEKQWLKEFMDIDIIGAQVKVKLFAEVIAAFYNQLSNTLPKPNNLPFPEFSLHKTAAALCKDFEKFIKFVNKTDNKKAEMIKNGLLDSILEIQTHLGDYDYYDDCYRKIASIKL